MPPRCMGIIIIAFYSIIPKFTLKIFTAGKILKHTFNNGMISIGEVNFYVSTLAPPKLQINSGLL